MSFYCFAEVSLGAWIGTLTFASMAIAFLTGAGFILREGFSGKFSILGKLAALGFSASILLIAVACALIAYGSYVSKIL